MDTLLNRKNGLNLTKAQFIEMAEGRRNPCIIPLCISIPLPEISPVDLYEGMKRRGENSRSQSFLLESMDGDEKTACYSFIGFKPVLRVKIGQQTLVEGDQRFVCLVPSQQGEDAVDTIKMILRAFHSGSSPAPRFSGGLVGYFAYDLIYSFLPRSKATRNDSGIQDPLAEFMLATDCIAIDHRGKSLWIIRNSLLLDGEDPAELYDRTQAAILEERENIEGLIAGYFPEIQSDKECRLSGDPGGISFTGKGKSPEEKNSSTIPVPGPCTGLTPDPMEERDVFIRSVEEIKRYIRQGEVVQTVISRKEEHPFPQDPFMLYRALRVVNPGPYMYYLDFSDHVVVGASPEMLVRVEGKTVTTVPIAGTRKRGREMHEDRELARELLEDPKEQAEHVMLVDLARNDLGSVCRYGSVRVPEFMEIGKYSHVQHIVSCVTGDLRDGADCFDAFRASFPAGTVTGAPKIRAMQIIDELEPSPRGLYAGAVGFIGFDQRMEFAIAIRTAVIRNGIASVQVGAGIVADSVPSREWTETEEKVAAMRVAIRAAGGSV